MVVSRIPVGRQHPQVAGDQVGQHYTGAGQADQEHGHRGGHGDPQPSALATLSPPGLVHVRRLPRDVGMCVPDDRLQGGGRLPLEVAHRGRADRYPEQIPAEPSHPPLADAVRPAEQGAHRLHTRPVPAAGVRRQGRAGDSPTVRARQAVPPVLGHDRADGGQLDDLMAERIGVVAGEGVRAPVTRAGA